MTGLLALTLIGTVVFDVHGLPALPAIAIGFLARERRPALAGATDEPPSGSDAQGSDPEHVTASSSCSQCF